MKGHDFDMNEIQAGALYNNISGSYGSRDNSLGSLYKCPRELIER